MTGLIDLHADNYVYDEYNISNENTDTNPTSSEYHLAFSVEDNDCDHIGSDGSSNNVDKYKNSGSDSIDEVDESFLVVEMMLNRRVYGVQ